MFDDLFVGRVFLVFAVLFLFKSCHMHVADRVGPE